MKPLTRKEGNVIHVVDTHGLSVTEWAERIRFGMRASIDAVLYLAWELKGAQADFQEQQEDGKIKSWRKAYNEMLDEAGLEKSKANRLIAISNAQHLKSVDKAILPEGYSVLAALAELPKTVFDRAMKAGEITPKITVRSVRELNPNRKESEGTSPRFKDKSITYTIDQAHDFLVAQLKTDAEIGIGHLVNIIADSGINPEAVIAKIEEVLL